MRAGLIAGALLALAVTEPALGQAEVPCTNIGQGRFECDWYRPGDGKTGGAIVAVGTTTVGYLHKGRNWIQCEEKGGDMRIARGLPATTGSAGRWPTTASGAGRARSTPPAATTTARSAAGRRPATARTARRRPTTGSGAPPRRARRRHPQPGAPTVDADKDGVSLPTDCDDTNSRIYPAPGVPERRRRPGLQRRRRRGRVSARSRTSTLRRKSTRLTCLRVTEAPAGATVT